MYACMALSGNTVFPFGGKRRKYHESSTVNSIQDIISMCVEHPFFVSLFTVVLFGDGISPSFFIPFTIVFHPVITASAMIVLNVVPPRTVVVA